MIKLFTDTSANLPLHLVRRYNITVLPFSYTLNGVEAENGAETEFDGKAFYDAMRSGADVKTSMINIVSFLLPFEDALQNGDDVLYVGMSGGISGTANAAAIAAADLKESYPERRICAVDSLAASLGEGLQVIEAAQMIEAGDSFDEIESHLMKRRETMCQFFTVDDLEYLKRGGRITGAAAFVGTVLHINPLLRGDEIGRIVLCGKARGMKRALDALAEKFDKLAADKAAPIGIAHADNESGMELLLGKLRDCGFTGECLSVCYEPVTGSHVGPGTVALFYRGTGRELSDPAAGEKQSIPA